MVKYIESKKISECIQCNGTGKVEYYPFTNVFYALSILVVSLLIGALTFRDSIIGQIAFIALIFFVYSFYKNQCDEQIKK